MTLPVNLKGEEMPTLATLESAEMVVSPVSTNPTTLKVSPMTLNMKSEEMPTHATTLEAADSDAAACPTTTNSLKPRNPTTNTGQDSPMTSTRPTKTNAAETSAYPMLPPHPLLRPSHRRVSHISAALLYRCICGMCDVEYILNGQGTSKVYGNQNNANGRKVIQYPVSKRTR